MKSSYTNTDEGNSNIEVDYLTFNTKAGAKRT